MRTALAWTIPQHLRNYYELDSIPHSETIRQRSASTVPLLRCTVAVCAGTARAIREQEASVIDKLYIRNGGSCYIKEIELIIKPVGVGV